MPDYAHIEYPNLNLLVDIGTTVSFSPELSNLQMLPHVPNYVMGIANLENSISLIIDFAKFLGIPQTDIKSETIFLHIPHKNGDIALKCPLPMIIQDNLKTERMLRSTSIIDRLPSSLYTIYNGVTYLIINIDALLDFISKEVTESMRNSWKATQPRWDEKNLVNLATKFSEVKSIIKSSNTAMMPSTAEHTSFLHLEVGPFNFVLEESEVEEIEIDTYHMTKIPKTPKWIRGITNYQNQSIISIDTFEYFDIQRSLIIQDNRQETLVICKSSKDLLVLNAEKISTIEKDELQPVYSSNGYFAKLPYSNILSDQYGQIYYKLHLDAIAHTIDTKERTSKQWQDWKLFFSADRVQYETEEENLIGELNNLNLVDLKVAQHALMLDQMQVQVINASMEFKQYKGFNFNKYKDVWIPSIDLNELYQTEKTSLSYGVVVSLGQQLVELRVDNATLSYNEDVLYDKSLISHIAHTSSDYGIANLYKTRDGTSFELDLENLAKIMKNMKNEDDKSVFQVTKEINKEFPIEIKEEKVISDYISAVWEKNTELFLLVSVEGNGFSRIAHPSEEVEVIQLETKDSEVIQWSHDTSEKDFFYVKLKSDKEKNGKDKNGKLYQMPANSYLAAISKDNIKGENGSSYINLENEKIPIAPFGKEVKIELPADSKTTMANA